MAYNDVRVGGHMRDTRATSGNAATAGACMMAMTVWAACVLQEVGRGVSEVVGMIYDADRRWGLRLVRQGWMTSGLWGQ